MALNGEGNQVRTAKRYGIRGAHVETIAVHDKPTIRLYEEINALVPLSTRTFNVSFQADYDCTTATLMCNGQLLRTTVSPI